MKFDLILFDIDGTLLDFNLTEKNALKETFEEYNFKFNNNIYERYHNINIFYWKELEKGKIDKDKLGYARFDQLFNEYNLKADSKEFNIKYRKKLGEGAYLLEGAEEICRYFYGKVKMATASNGGKDIQLKRMKKVGLDKYMDYMFISEEIGYNKPDKKYFDYIFNKIGDISKDRIIIIGDSLTADILGGINSGIKTCWINLTGEENIENITPDFKITNILQLKEIIG